MQLPMRRGAFRATSLFKFVFVGVLIGEGLIFGIPFAAILALGLMGGPIQTSGFPPSVLWMFPVILPLIILGHALMFGGMIVLGLAIYSRWGKLEVVEES